MKPYSKQAPAPGIYPGVPADEYRAWRAWNQSVLKQETPKAMKAAFQGSDPSGAMITGDRLHAAVLDRVGLPESGISEYHSATSNRKRKLSHDSPADYWSEVRAQDPDAWAEDQIALVAKMRAAILRNSVAAALIAETPMECREVSLVWQDRTTGLLCKARADIFDPARRLIADLKSASDIAPRAMAKACVEHGYYLQAGMYTLAGAALCPEAGFTPKSVDYRIIAVDKSADPECVVYTMPDDGVTYTSDGSMAVWISRGVEQMRAQMLVAARCLKAAAEARAAGGDADAVWHGRDETGVLEPPRWWHEQWGTGLDVVA
jgi:hypothetical protein